MCEISVRNKRGSVPVPRTDRNNYFLHSPWMLEPQMTAPTTVISGEALRPSSPNLFGKTVLSRSANFENVAVGDTTASASYFVRDSRCRVWHVSSEESRCDPEQPDPKCCYPSLCDGTQTSAAQRSRLFQYVCRSRPTPARLHDDRDSASRIACHLRFASAPRRNVCSQACPPQVALL